MSCPHAHQQNGAAERKHRHIVEVGLSLLAQSSMPLKYWDQAFLATTYLINRTPSRVINHETPLERLFKMQVDYSSLIIFGCACWPNLRPYNAHKLAFCSKQCAFLGYSNLHKGFKCLDIASGRVYRSRDVVFDENIFPFSSLNPNATARFHSESNLLSPNLLSSSSSGDANTHDNSANVLPSSATNHLSSVQKNSAENGAFVLLSPHTGHEMDSSDPSVRGAGVSASDPVLVAPSSPRGGCSPSGTTATAHGGRIICAAAFSVAANEWCHTAAPRFACGQC